MASTTVFVLALFKIAVFLLIIPTSFARQCECSQQQFNTPIRSYAKASCTNCFEFVYDFTFSQEWTPHICVSSSIATRNNPLLVVVRESINVMSFEVPSTLGEADFSEVCHTICPLANNFDDKLVEGKQSVFVEVSSKDVNGLYYNLTLSKREDFIFPTDEAMTLKLTPAIPSVFQYNLGNASFRVEANSSDDNCMIVAVQNITCPFHDTERTVEHGGFYQTSMRKAGLAITKNTFNIDRVYIVLILNPTDEDCIAFWSSNVKQQYSKEVTLRVVPNISTGMILAVVLGNFAIYFVICLLLFACFYRIFKSSLTNTDIVEKEEKKNKENDGTGDQKQDKENDGTGNQTQDKENDGTGDQTQDEENYGTEDLTHGNDKDRTKVPPENVPLRNVAGSTSQSHSIEMSAEYLRKFELCKAELYVSDLSTTDADVIYHRSNLYKWNLVLIGIFYVLPVVQLVLMNQNIVNITGNQDLCYYNYLCANQLGILSDSSHFFSNMGYVMLGILSLIIVYVREKMLNSVIEKRRINHPDVLTGIPHQFGLLYAMGWALIMEGVLSACYHICPNWTNYQFDMTYMYVISIMTILKLYQARHPDLTLQSHIIWSFLALIILIEVFGIVFRHIAFWYVFAVVHILFLSIALLDMYFMGQYTFSTKICGNFFGSLRKDESCHYKGRLGLLILVLLINITVDIVFIVKRPGSLGLFILAVCLVNVGVYFLYYMFIKCKSNEKFGCLRLCTFGLIIALWGTAIKFFCAANSEWAATPAESRNVNTHCKQEFNYFDDHDIWHMTSSFALFFTFMLLLIMDDDIEIRPRDKILVF